MTPEQRKAASELLLHKRGIRINLQLPLTEEDDEVVLRSEDELVQRMLALWAVVQTAGESQTTQPSRYLQYFTTPELTACLSPQETAFLHGDDRDEFDFARFALRRESLFFLAWCGGLSESLPMPATEAHIEAIAALLRQGLEQPGVLRQAIRIRSRKEIMDWSDLLYRLHWAVRHAELIGKALPGNLNGNAVREWHQAANWMTCYEEENNWDHVSTETQ